MSVSLQAHGLYPTKSLCPWDFLGKNTGAGCHALLQGTFQSRHQSPPALAGRFFTTTAAKSLQLCPTLCNHIDGSPPGSSVPGILQARILEWVAISFFNACMHANSLQLSPTLCDPMGRSPPGSSVRRILQARILKWVAIAFSRNRDPELGVRRSCSWQVRRERFPVFPGKRGTWC